MISPVLLMPLNTSLASLRRAVDVNRTPAIVWLLNHSTPLTQYLLAALRIWVTVRLVLSATPKASPSPPTFHGLFSRFVDAVCNVMTNPCWVAKDCPAEVELSCDVCV